MGDPLNSEATESANGSESLFPTTAPPMQPFEQPAYFSMGLNVGLPGGPGGAGLPQGVSYPTGVSKTGPASVAWLLAHFELQDGISLNRNTLYSHYCDYCRSISLEPANTASFGKIIRSVFPNLKTRRLGTRGNSKYHYYGLKLKDESPLHFDPEHIGGPNHRVKPRLPNGVKPKLPKPEKGERPRKKSTSTSSKKSAKSRRTYGVLPPFPAWVDPPNDRFALEFSDQYHVNCQETLSLVLQQRYGEVGEEWRQFWGTVPMLSREFIGGESGLRYLNSCDEVYFETLSNTLMLPILSSLSEQSLKDLRAFSKSMESLMRTALEGYSETFVGHRTRALSFFARSLKRYTTLNHFAQSARPVLQDDAHLQKMLIDFTALDFRSLQAQARIVCPRCNNGTAGRLAEEFKVLLSEQADLERCTRWINQTIQQLVSPDPSSAMKLIPQWMYFCSLIIRDLTFRSAESFGSFHLLCLFSDEYVMFLLEQVSVKGMAFFDMIQNASGINHSSSSSHVVKSEEVYLDEAYPEEEEDFEDEEEEEDFDDDEDYGE